MAGAIGAGAVRGLGSGSKLSGIDLGDGIKNLMGNIVPTPGSEMSGSNTVGPNTVVSDPNSGFQNWLSEKIGLLFQALGPKGTAIAKGIGAIIIIGIVIVIIVFLVMGGMKLFSKKKKSRRSAAYKKKSKKSKTKKSWYSELWSKISGFRNPLGTKAYGGLPRAIENEGRCDNINWLTINNGKTSMCINASFKQPDPIRFTIDPTNLYEYEMLPNTIKNKIRTNTEKLSITIPYKYNEKPSAYVLDFSKAVYEDGKTANELFNERFNFDYWNFKPKNLNKAPSGYEYRYESKFRPLKTDSKYKGLDSYL